ncbi:MAG: ABC transporter permease [Candidatus Omnitrophota bacterium]
MKTELYLAWRYLFRGKARHISFIGIVSCLGIALGVATLIIVISVMNGFDRDLTDKLMRFNHHLTVESFDSEKIPQIKKTIDSWEDVETAGIFLQTQVFAKFNNLIVPLTVKGIDFKDKQEAENFYQYAEKEQSDQGFFIGEGLKKRFFILNEIEFYPLEKELKLRKGKVRGVFKTGLYDIDSSCLVTTLEEAKILSSNYFLFLGVRLKDSFEAAKIKEKIMDSFPGDVFVSTWMDTNRALFSALKLEKITMFIILSLIILVACFNVFATLTIGVVEKTKDIGILKSLGFSSRRILSIFSFQGLILGFMGTSLGAILGLGLCFILKNYPFIKLPEEIYYIEYLPVAINLRDILLIVFVGFFLSYIFSLFPAKRAAKMLPSRALRYE